MDFSTGSSCEVESCSAKVIPNAKKHTQLCSQHATDRDAMLAQAAKSPPVVIDGARTSLRDYLEKIETEDKPTFLMHLGEFTEKFLGFQPAFANLILNAFTIRVRPCHARLPVACKPVYE